MKRIFIIVVIITVWVGCKKDTTPPPTSNPPQPTSYPPQSADIAGTDGTIYAMTIYNNNLVIGGGFDRAGNIEAHCIVLWNGSKWASIGDLNPVSSLYVYNGNLIAGTVDGNIMQWNGNSWIQIGETFGRLSEVVEFTTYNGNLIAAGEFDSITGVKTNNIAQWNGSTWSSLDSGLSNVFGSGITSIVVYKGNLIAAVNTTVEEWNGSNWLSLASTSGWVQGLCVDSNNLVVGGQFNSIAGIPATSVAQWNGSTWSSLNNKYIGGNDDIQCICIDNGNIIIGLEGDIVMSNGSKWSFIGSTQYFLSSAHMYAPGHNNACIVYNGNLYIAGYFDPNNITMWNGSAWSAF